MGLERFAKVRFRRTFRKDQRGTLGTLLGSIIGQRTRKRHEDDQSDNRDDYYHDDYLWVAETLACDHECGGNVALASTKRQDPSRVAFRSAQQPTNPKAQCDK